jgi:hypothetical protein
MRARPSGRIVRRSRINGAFTGFDGDALFRLADGSAWVQAEYRYWYHYAYRPEALILERGGRISIEVAGESVSVRRAQILSEGTIDGEFRGWDGESQYRLTNGEVWQQAAYKYEYVYSYRPEAVVYEASSGTVIAVEGTRASVRRVR